MIFYNNDEGCVFFVKCNSHKSEKVITRQIMVFCEYIVDRNPLMEGRDVNVKFGYVNDDFAKNKHTYQIIFKNKVL